MRAISEVCGVCLDLPGNRGWVGREARALLDAGYLPSDIHAFLHWWQRQDGSRRGRLPSLRSLRREIGRARADPRSRVEAGGPRILDLGPEFPWGES